MKLFYLLIYCIFTAAISAEEGTRFHLVSVNVWVKSYKENGLRISRSNGEDSIFDLLTCEVSEGKYAGRSIQISLPPTNRPSRPRDVIKATIDVADYAFSEENDENVYRTATGLRNIIMRK